MKKMSVGEFKANFSQALKNVLAGEEIGISYGKNKEIVARLVPNANIFFYFFLPAARQI